MNLKDLDEHMQQSTFHDVFIDLIGSISIVRELSELDCHSDDENGLIDSALKILMQNQVIERCSFFLLNKDGVLENVVGMRCDETLGLKVFNGVTKNFKIGEGIIGLAAETGELQYCRDSKKDPRFTANNGDTSLPGSLISAPIFADNGLMGVINISHPETDHFSEWHISLLNIVKNMLGQLIYNHRLYKDMEEQISNRTNKLQNALDEAKALKERYESLSMIDDLTGLYNRRYFYDQTDIAISRSKRYKQDFCLLILDLDRFKEINDQYGHINGDQVLIDFSKCLKQQIRSTDVLARFGGEEFVVIFADTNNIDGLNFAERIRNKVESLTWNFKGEKIGITVSIGIFCPTAEEIILDNLTINCLINKADRALYKAKEEGRNQVVAFTTEMEKNSE